MKKITKIYYNNYIICCRYGTYKDFPKDALEHGKHLTQKYYHRNISRPEAERLLQKVNEDG